MPRASAGLADFLAGLSPVTGTKAGTFDFQGGPLFSYSPNGLLDFDKLYII